MHINVTTDWKEIITDQTKLPYWKKLEQLVDTAYESKIVFPHEQDIFACFNYFNFSQTKVVILGQDPYYNAGQANGLAFSVNNGIPLPKSLINIFKELEQDLGAKRSNGDLSDWAKQGVLLLNNTLTVEASISNSHASFGWDEFTNNVIETIDQKLNHVVFVLWGNFAQGKIPLLNNKNNRKIIAPHPSPLSATRGFFGSKPFSEINNWLKKHKHEEIKW